MLKKLLFVIIFSCLFVGVLVFLYLRPPRVVLVESGDYVKLAYCRRDVTTTDIVYVYNGTITVEFLDDYKVNWTQTLREYVIYPNGSVREKLERQHTEITETEPYVVNTYADGVMYITVLLRTDKLEPGPYLVRYYQDTMQTSFGLRNCEAYVSRRDDPDPAHGTVWWDKALLGYRGGSWYLELKSLGTSPWCEHSMEVIDTNLFSKPVWKLTVYGLPLRDWTIRAVVGWSVSVAVVLGAPWIYAQWKRHRILSQHNRA